MTTKNAYLHALGIQPWELRSSEQISLPDWETLRACVRDCTACSLHKNRTQTVFGVGNTQAELMFIGEGPGYHEDQRGEPFVGRAGQLLNAMLQAVGFDRETVYIANIVKCRPPENRDPTPEEVAQCTPYLEKQIQYIQPKLIVALGKVATNFLLNTKVSLSQCRGKVHHYANTPLIATYHPAYLLRNPVDKKNAFLDLQMVLRFLSH